MINNINKIMLTGRMTKDPEIRYTTNGTAVCTFSVANNYVYSGEQKVSFFNCVAYGKTADAIVAFVKKGHTVGISGILIQKNLTTNDDKKRSACEIIIENIEFLTPKSLDDGQINMHNNDLPF